MFRQCAEAGFPDRIFTFHVNRFWTMCECNIQVWAPDQFQNFYEQLFFGPNPTHSRKFPSYPAIKQTKMTDRQTNGGEDSTPAENGREMH